MTTAPILCPFCQSAVTGKRSREHVFPKWLLRVLSTRRIPVRTSLFNKSGQETGVRHHTLDELVLGGVCQDCNHGWMSQLEQVAAPIVRRLAFGGGTLQSLDAAQCFALSRWAVKTAVTLNLSSGFERLFKPSVVSELANNPLDLPLGFYVAGTTQRPTDVPIDWLQVAGISFYAPIELAPDALQDRLAKDALRIGFLIGALCLVVVYWPHPEWRIAIWPEVHEMLWPPNANPFYVEHRYPGEPNPLDVAPRLFLYRALGNIGVTSEGGEGTIKFYQPKNRHTFVSGPEPAGRSDFLPIPDVITPEIDAHIKAWMKDKSKPPTK